MFARNRETEIRDRDRELGIEDVERSASSMGGKRRGATKKSTTRTNTTQGGRSKNRKKK